MFAWGSTSNYNKFIEAQGVNLNPLPKDRLIIAAGNTSSIWPIIKKKGLFSIHSQDTAQELLDLHPGISIHYEFDMSPAKFICFHRLIQSLPYGDGSKVIF